MTTCLLNFVLWCFVTTYFIVCLWALAKKIKINFHDSYEIVMKNVIIAFLWIFSFCVALIYMCFVFSIEIEYIFYAVCNFSLPLLFARYNFYNQTSVKWNIHFSLSFMYSSCNWFIWKRKIKFRYVIQMVLLLNLSQIVVLKNYNGKNLNFLTSFF